MLQRDPQFYTDPDRFDPARFSPGWEERIPRYAYLPFGGGPRVCIGNGFAMMEARLILATVAQHYELSLESPQEIKPGGTGEKREGINSPMGTKGESGAGCFFRTISRMRSTTPNGHFHWRNAFTSADLQ